MMGQTRTTIQACTRRLTRLGKFRPKAHFRKSRLRFAYNGNELNILTYRHTLAAVGTHKPQSCCFALLYSKTLKSIYIGPRNSVCQSQPWIHHF